MIWRFLAWIMQHLIDLVLDIGYNRLCEEAKRIADRYMVTRDRGGSGIGWIEELDAHFDQCKICLKRERTE